MLQQYVGQIYYYIYYIIYYYDFHEVLHKNSKIANFHCQPNGFGSFCSFQIVKT